MGSLSDGTLQWAMLLIGEAVCLVMGRLFKYVCERKIDLEIMFLGASEMAQ